MTGKSVLDLDNERNGRQLSLINDGHWKRFRNSFPHQKSRSFETCADRIKPRLEGRFLLNPLNKHGLDTADLPQISSCTKRRLLDKVHHHYT